MRSEHGKVAVGFMLAACETVVHLEEVMHIVFRFLDAVTLILRVPEVSPTWRRFVETFGGPVSLDLRANTCWDRQWILQQAHLRMPRLRTLRIGEACVQIGGFSEALRCFKNVRELSLDVRWFFPASYAGLMALPACTSLTLWGCKMQGLKLLAVAGSRVKSLDITMTGTHSLYPQTRTAVLLVLSRTDLTALKLRNVALNRFELATALRACPTLQTLELWHQTDDTNPDCLAAIRDNSKGLKDLTFTVNMDTYGLWSLTDLARRTRQAYIKEALGFLEQGATIRTLRLCNLDGPLKDLATLHGAQSTGGNVVTFRCP